MKKLLIFLTLAIPAVSQSQNLLLNPGFEDSLQCPSGSGAFVNYVANWTKPSYGSADYFYTGCAVSPTDEPPRTGNACAGIICYDPANIREYMTGHLSAPLSAGVTYSVSFYVSLNNSSMEAINEIGAYLTATPINNANALPIILTPQVQGSIPYTTQSGWQLVQGSFVASGGEQYIILGCFLPDSLMTFTTVSTTGWGDVYYFFDDVCVSPDINPCVLPTGIHEKQNLDAVAVYPNPADESTTLTFENSPGENYELSVFDSRGQLVMTKTGITSGTVEIERNNLTSGLYFFRLQSPEKIMTGKFALK